MKRNTAAKVDNSPTPSASRSLARCLAGFKTRIQKGVDAHHARTEALRVYSATRLDGRDGSAGRPVAGSATAATPHASPGLLRRLWRRLGAAWAAHEARLIELRVFGRPRG